MKILFVYSTLNSVSTMKCCFELSKALNQYSITKVISYKEFNKEIINQFDIIIFHRIGEGNIISESDKKSIISIIKENKSKTFIYMIDDLIIEDRNGVIKDLARECDAVMCSTERLCNNFMTFNKNVYRFKTFIDCDFYNSIKNDKNEVFTIAWISSGGLGINIINQILERKRYMGIDFNFIAIGGQSYRLIKSNNIRCYGVISEEDMIKLVKESHVLLNPITVSSREENIIKLIYKSDVEQFLNSKSEIKYLISGMCNSCLITSKTESYKTIINDGINGFKVSNDILDWVSIITKLYYDRDIISKVTNNAYNNIKDVYDINIISKNIYDNLKKIYNKSI